MKQHVEEYGLVIIVTIIILSLITAMGLLNTQVKSHVNDKLQTSLSESGVTQLDPEGEALVGSGNGGFVVDIGNAYGVLPIEKGGTSATSREQAMTNLGLGETATLDIVPIKNGGTNATNATDAVKNIGAIKDSEVLNATYPVGSIYMSVSSTNPGELFGGTWTQMKDKFLLAAGDTYSAGSTGGSADAVVVKHTHSVSGTAASAGAHTHTINMRNSTSSSDWNATRKTSKAHSGWARCKNAGAHTHSVSGKTASAGKSGTGANMPPYLTVYMWERTA